MRPLSFMTSAANRFLHSETAVARMSLFLLKKMILRYQKGIFFFLFALSLGLNSSAQTTKTWNGSKNTAWTNSGNWTPASVPTTGDTVVVSGTVTIGSVSSTTLGGLFISGNVTLTGAATLTVNNSFRVDSSYTLTLNTGPLNLTLASAATGTVRGVVNATAGTFLNEGNLSIASGAYISGAAAFTLGNAATLQLASPDGIAGTAAGNIRVSGTKTFPASANYILNGSSTQSTGTGFPTSITGSLSINNPNTVTLSSGLTLSGVLNLNQGTFNIGSALSLGSTVINRNGGSFSGTPGGSTNYSVNYTGANKSTGTELALSGGTLRRVTVNMNSGANLTLDASRTVSDTLVLTSGVVNTGTFTLTLNGAVLTGGSSSSYISGKLQRRFLSGGNLLFPIGSSSGYLPVTINYATGAGTVTASTTNGDISATTPAQINLSNSVNRFWSFTNSGFSASAYTATVNWLSADRDGGYDEANAGIGNFTNSAWSYLNPTSSGATSMTFSGTNLSGDFQIAKKCTPTAISIQPQGGSICPGQSVPLSVSATGDNLTYQWYKDGSNITLNGTTSSYAATSGGSYTVVVTGDCGTVTSAAATVVVKKATTISVQPQGGDKCLGSTLSVTADGEGTLTYQWRRDGLNISNATASSYIIDAPGKYEVVVAGGCGSGVLSDAANVNLKAATAITTQPDSGAICSGSSKVLSVVAAGANLTYQWRRDGSAITLNGTSSSYTATQAGTYSVVVGGDCGSVTSGNAVIRLKTATSITTQPQSAGICSTGSHTLSVTAVGEGLAYQWYKDGSILTGETSSSYITNVSGSYAVVVNGDCGSVTSGSATIRIKPTTSITTNPVTSFAICAGSVRTISVVATGENLSYQWKRNNSNISGATSASYVVSDAGTYSVVVTGDCGTATSTNTTVTLKTETAINTQPISAAICPGAITTLSVAAVGERLTYQWYKNGVAISLATLSSYTTQEAGTYTVEIIGDCGTLTSNDAVVRIKTVTSISSHPVGDAICPGSSKTLSVVTSGEGLTYQWYLNSSPISGANASSYDAALEGIYSVIVNGDCGSVTSNTATITHKVTTLINVQPVGAEFCPGGSQLLSVDASGTNLKYQWTLNGVAISGATEHTYLATATGSYAVVVTGDCGTLTSASAAIRVKTATSITTQPQGGAICEGINRTLSVVAAGENLTYQWALNGITINGATAASYMASLAGDYTVVVSGACGEVASSLATVRVSTKTAITTEPVGGAICPGSSLVLSVTAAGEQLTYQWLRNNVAISLNGTSSTYTATQGGTYTVTVSGACGTATSTGVDVRVKTVTSITSQPSSGAICPGSSQVLSVTAAGENLNYQWKKDGSDITLNGTASTYTATQAGNYTVVVTGDCGSVTSSGASIRIKTVTSITTQPAGGLICPGNQKTLTVVAAGEGLAYQWQKDGVNISQATSATYYAAEAGNYQVVVTGDCGTVTSSAVQVVLRTATSITSQPIGADLCPGLTLPLSVTALGDNITYQWKRDGAVIANATNSSYTATIAGTYTVDVVGTCGSTTSASAVLRFKTVTSITSQPTGATICPGSTQALSVQAVGEGLSYQWQKDGQPIPLATSSIFSATDAGFYTVVVKGDCGMVTSSAAIIILKNATIINTQPVGGAICPGGSVQLSVSATGDNLSYQWKRDGVVITNATSSSYLATLGGNYTVDVKGDCDLVTSTAASLRIKTVTSITTQPVSGSICSGTSYELSVVAAGENLTYQWRKDGVSILGASTSTYSATEIGTYTVTVTGDCGTVTSTGAGISFNSATTVTSNPQNRTITYGNNTSFSAQGMGTGTITYKWQVNSGSGWTDIVANGTYSNPTLSTLTLTKPSGINSGNLYQCVITGTCGFSATTAVTLTINKVAATVTAQNKTRVYGDPDPDFTVTYGGFIAGETFETSDITGLPQVTTTATAKSSPGTYPINPALGTLSSYNYSFTYASASLSITAAPLIIKAADTTEIYGSVNKTLFTIAYEGLKNGETLATSDITGTAPTASVQISGTPKVGTYTITISPGNQTSKNYSITYSNGTLTVAKATLLVTADNKTRTYGAVNPALTYVMTGFVNNENLSNSGVTGTPDVTTFAMQNSPVGNYDILPSLGTLFAFNYTFKYINGTLAINKATLTVTADTSSRVYGAPDPVFTAKIAGYVLSQTAATSGVTGAPGFSTNASVTSPVGAYSVTPNVGSLLSDNYTFSYVSAAFNIRKAPLIAKADTVQRFYGGANPALTVTYIGFANGETLATSGITGTPTLSTSATSSSIVGTYQVTISAGTQASGNYVISYVNGALRVNKAILSVTAQDKSRAYAEANPAFTYSITGYVLGQDSATSGMRGMATLSTVATSSSPAGSYPIVPAVGTLTASNYTFAMVNGNLNIGKVMITVRAQNAARAYGAPDPVFTATYSGFVNGETLGTSDIQGQPGFTTPATATSSVGNYAILAARGGLTSTNYDFQFVNAILTINQALVTVSADNQSTSYGDEIPVLTVTYTGFANGETSTSGILTGAPVVTTTATKASGIGAYPIVATVGTLSAQNYSFIVANGQLTVNRAILKVTANNVSKTYGSANPDITAYTISGYKNGEETASNIVTGSPVASTSVTSSTAVGTYAITLVPGTLAAANYAFQMVEGAFTVSRAQITVTALNTNRLYGGVNPSFFVSYAGFVLGESRESGAISGIPSLTTQAINTTKVGVYDIVTAIGTLTSTNYSFVLVNGKLTIDKAPLKITAENKSRIYGAANPLFTANYEGFVNGEDLLSSKITGQPNLSTQATSGSDAGNYAISISNGDLFSENYAFTLVPGLLTIDKALMRVYADNQSKLYGEAMPRLTYRFDGFMNNETLTSGTVTGSPVLSTTATSASPVNSYPITMTLGTLFATNYNFELNNATLTVGKAILRVTADNKSKTYGQVNPTLTYSLTGYVNGETSLNAGVTGTPSLLTTALNNSGAGTYDITPSIGSLSASNYDFNFVNGVFTINKALLTITAEKKNRIYGAANPQFTATATGFVNGDDLFSGAFSGNAAMATTAIGSSAPGNYPISIAIGTLTSPNYTFTLVGNTLTISKAPVTVIADNKTRPYGSANPTLTWSYDGLMNGETAATSDITGTANISTTAKSTSSVGVYPISIAAGSLSSVNYALSYVAGDFTIAKAPLNITANDASRAYGSANPAFAATITGLVNGDRQSQVYSGSPSITTSAVTSSPAGIYDLVPTQGTLVLTSTNYYLNYVNGKLTVNKVNLTVGVQNATRAYGAPNPVFTATYSGFVNGDSYASSGITGQPAFTTTATATSGVGTYTLTPTLGTLSSTNYNFTSFTNGTLTISKAALTVAADNKNRFYGSANPTLTYRYVGFVNGDSTTTGAVTGTPTISTTAINSSNAGSYTITMGAGNLASANYAISVSNGTLTVNKALLTVTARDSSRPYGAANPTFGYTLTGYVLSQTYGSSSGVNGIPNVTSTATPSSSAATTWPITPSLGTLTASNYDFVFVDGKLTITKGTVIVTADAKTRGYGNANPVFTATFSGFLNGETLATSDITGTPTFTTTATALSPVGTTYPIIPSSIGLASANYTFTFVNGALTITKANLNVIAVNKSRVYGDQNPSLTFVYNGFVNGDSTTTGAVTGQPMLSTAATTASPAGAYDILIGNGNLAATNYTFTFVKGSLTVNKALLTVTAANASRNYGAADPQFSLTYNGFKNGQTLATSGITGSAAVVSATTATSSVGNYPIEVALGSLSSGNYDFSFVNGNLAITKASLRVLITNASKVYGTNNPSFAYAYDGFVNSENELSAQITGAPLLTSPATSASGVGSYPITGVAGSLSAPNYDFTFVNGSLAITKAVLTATVDNKSRPYGVANPEFTVSYNGFVNGDNALTIGLGGQILFTTLADLNSPQGQYDVFASAGSLVSANYDFQFVKGILTIGKAMITVRPVNVNKTYGQPNPALTYVLEGFLNGDNATTAGVSGEPVLATNAVTSSGAGLYEITTSIGTLSSTNYDFGLAKGVLTIDKAPLIVKAADQSRIYGASDPSFSYTINGFVNGDDASVVSGIAALSTTATQNSGAGIYPIQIAAGSLTALNYSFTLQEGTLTIGKAKLLVKAANQSRAYGAANPEFTAAYNGFVNGDQLGTINLNGTINFSTLASNSSAVGDYDITVASSSLSSPNYEFDFGMGKLTVTKASLSVRAENKTKIYGQVNPALTYTINGYLNNDGAGVVTGTPVLSTLASTGSGVGDYAIGVSEGTLSATNYSFTVVPGKLTIGKATLTIQATDKSRIYGAANPDLTYTLNGFVNGENASVVSGLAELTTTATAGSNAGNYLIRIALGTLSASNYDFSLQEGTLAVGKAKLTVKAINQSRTYGAANPEFVATYNGFVNGDQIGIIQLNGTISFSTLATNTSAVGDYDITVASSTLSSTNYDFEEGKGILSITKAQLHVRAENKKRIYGQANPSLTYTIDGYLNNDGLNVVSGAPVLSTLATTASGAGDYEISLTAGTLVATNYTFSLVPGKLTIDKATLTVKAADKNKIYGAVNPDLTFTFNGFLNGDNASVVSGLPVLSTAATQSSGAGTYPISIAAGTLTASNYTFTMAEGNLVIGKAKLVVKAANQTRVYGAANPSFTATYNGLVNGDQIGSINLNGAISFSTLANTTTAVGDYDITVATSTLASPNYEFELGKGTLSITKAQLNVRADNKSRIYGQSNPALTYTINGYLNNDGVNVVNGAPVLSTSANAASGAGEYTITLDAGTLAATNYTFSLASGQLTIGKATLMVKASDKSRIYGGANPELTYTLNGFVNGDNDAVVSGNAFLSTTATASSRVGSYPIQLALGSLSASNYNFNPAEGTLVINKATLTVKADNKSRNYGNPNPDFTATISGYVNGELLETSGVSGRPAMSTLAEVNSITGDYDIDIAAGSLASTNYDFVFSKGKLSIGKAIITVTAVNKSRIYGQANPAFTYTYNGFINGEVLATSDIQGEPASVTVASVSSGVGDYDIVPELGTLTSNKYQFAFAKGVLTIQQAVLTVTANGASRSYGAANPSFTASYAGFVNGEELSTSDVKGTPSLTTAAVASTSVGNYDINAAIGTLTSKNYSFRFATGVLKIEKVKVLVTANNASRIYGTENPKFTASYSGFANNETLATAGISGEPLLQTAATKSTGIGSYAIEAAAGTLASGNYSFEFATGTLTIGKATLEVRVNNQQRIYGQPNPVLTVGYAGFMNGENEQSSQLTGSPVVSTLANEKSEAGIYTIEANQGTLAAPNYDFSITFGQLTIGKAILKVTAQNANKLYGQANPGFTATYNGFVNGESLSTSSITGRPALTTLANENSGVGIYPITASLGTLSSTNYDFTFEGASLTIGKASMKIKVASATRMYGVANPRFTVEYSGFVNNETLTSGVFVGTPVISTAAVLNSPVGIYPITASLGTLDAVNYDFTFEQGLLTVTKAPLTLTAENKARKYGESNPAFSFQASGFMNSENWDNSGITGQPMLSTESNASSPAGQYAILLSNGSLNGGNYELSFVNGQLEIGKAMITVKAEDKSRIYGSANPQLTATYTGFVNGENLASSGIAGAPALNTLAAASSRAGIYSISAGEGTLSAGNYEFQYTEGKLTIGKATLSITAENKSRKYGEANPSLTYTLNGFVLGESTSNSDISGLPVLSTSASAASAVGSYDIITGIGSLSSNNYSFVFNKGTLTIGKAVLAITADNKSRKYGEMNPNLTFQASGFKNGQVWASSGINGLPSVTTTADLKSGAGSYTITAGIGTLSSANYDFEFTNGSLVVDKALLTIAVENKSRTYGQANPALSATYAGFMNGESLYTSDLSGQLDMSTLATPSSPAGAYAITANAASVSSNNYAISITPGTLTIGKATVTITAEPKGRSYGVVNPQLTVTYNGLMNGETLATSGITGQPALSTNAAVNSPVGTYDINVGVGNLSSANYTFQFNKGVLSIGRATITYVATNASKVYGEAMPRLTFTTFGYVNEETSVTSDIAGSPVVSTVATASSAAGSYDIVIQKGSLSSNNYIFNFVNGTLTVNKATVTITAENKGRVYGQANPEFTATYAGFVNGETLATSGILGTPYLYTDAIPTSEVGNYAINASVGTLTAPNYTFNFVPGILKIARTAITITAETKSRVYGTDNPELTYVFSGFAPGESLASSDITGDLDISTTATINSPAGSYPIVLSQGSLYSNNYVFNIVSGSLRITKAPLTIIAENKSKIYGSANPALTVNYMGFMNGETLATSGITGAPLLTTTATMSSGVDLYDIVVQKGNLSSINYDFTYINGSLIVKKAMLTVTADSKTKFYGQDNPALTYSFSGFVNNESAASGVIYGAPVLATSALSTSDVGVYPITIAAGNLSSANYAFTLVKGSLTVAASNCSVSGLLSVSDVCSGSPINLTFFNTSGSGPFTLVINDSVYKNVMSGVPFASGTIATTAPESIFGSQIAPGTATGNGTATELGMKFRTNVAGQITGVRFYKHAANTGTHTGSLWSSDGKLLATATFANETASGWQQVNFSAPVNVTSGSTYVISYFAPNGNYAYAANGFTAKRITNGTGTLTAFKGSEGGNGFFKVGGGFPSDASADNGNYFVDVVFNNTNSISRFALSGILSATGCSSNGSPLQAVEAKMGTNYGVTVEQQQGLECMENTTGTIAINAYGCSGPFAYSLNGGDFQSNGLYTNLAAGTYQIKIRDAANQVRDTAVVIGAEKALWTGAVSADWHNAANWSTGKVPGAKTHVIIPVTNNECVISAADISVASIQVKAGANLRVLNDRRIEVTGKCMVLPIE